MDKMEVAELLGEIDVLYPGRIKTDDPAARFNSFCKALESYDAKLVMRNLDRHVKVSPHPPNIAELVRKPETSTVPNAEKTREYFDRYYKRREPTEEEKKVAEEEKAKMRKILGID